VQYDSEIPEVEQPVDQNALLKALSHKSKDWRYEDEVRIVSSNEKSKFFENIKIKEINFGLKTSHDDMKLVKNIINDNGIKFYQTCFNNRKYSLNKTDITHLNT
jgi:hypothetical protein